jgi:hypothetical protein
VNTYAKIASRAYCKILQLTCSTRRLPDIAPRKQDGVMRWPNGDVWIPEPTPPQRSGLFGRPTQLDWQAHTLAAAAQVLALARLTPHAEQE